MKCDTCADKVQMCLAPIATEDCEPCSRAVTPFQECFSKRKVKQK